MRERPKSPTLSTTNPSTQLSGLSAETSSLYGSSGLLPRLRHPSNRRRLQIKIDARIAELEREAWDVEAQSRAQYTAQAAKRLDEVREKCKTLHGFVQEAWPILEPSAPFVDGWVIKAICDHLEAVSAGKITRLLINVPPGMMKSLLVGVLWPAWEWTFRPAKRYLATSYSGPNVIRDNNKMRRLVESDWYQNLWGESVKPARKWGEKKFENTATGGRDGRPFAKVTGGRGDTFFIDDPHSTEGAESDKERKKTVRIFGESLSDRLNDMQRGAIVVIMQRLHTMDVSGAIFELMEKGEVWTCLILPMEFEADRRCTTYLKDGTEFFTDPRTEDGELLFEERFPRAVVQSLKTVKGAYAYAGQYQQRPSPREGGLFMVDRIEKIPALPAGIRKTVRGWDFAGTIAVQGTDPDYTVGVKVSRDHEGFIYIEDVKRVRNKGNEVRKLVIKTAQDDGGEVRVRYPQDPGSAGKSVAEDYGRALAGFMFTYAQPTGAKDIRATPFANQVEAGNVRMLIAPWNDDFITELRGFPTAKHDDQVDAASDAVNEVCGVVPSEGLLEYYRQEAERVRALAAGESGHVAPADMVGLLPPAGLGMAYGRYGDEYRLDPATGIMWVKPIDAPGYLSQVGWSAVPVSVEA